MPPLYPSPGPFPNHRALDAVGKDELRKAYYETTSNRALPSRMGSQDQTDKTNQDESVVVATIQCGCSMLLIPKCIYSL
eukprot:g15447.t1